MVRQAHQKIFLFETEISEPWPEQTKCVEGLKL